MKERWNLCFSQTLSLPFGTHRPADSFDRRDTPAVRIEAASNRREGTPPSACFDIMPIDANRGRTGEFGFGGGSLVANLRGLNLRPDPFFPQDLLHQFDCWDVMRAICNV